MRDLFKRRSGSSPDLRIDRLPVYRAIAGIWFPQLPFRRARIAARSCCGQGIAEVRSLNQAVARNRKRFPADFAFQLTDDELAALRSQLVISKSPTSQASSRLRSQIVTSNTGRGGRRYLPYAFTEQGVAMLSSVLRSARAVEVNIAIMRTFVQLRRLMDSNRDLARKIEALKKKYDEQFSAVFAAIKELISEPPPPTKRIGFHP